MSYHAGVGGHLAAMLRVEPGDPRVVCDGCGLVRSVTSPYGIPYRWFLDRYLDGKPVPGWFGERTEGPDGVKHLDLCPECKPKTKGRART
jgi:hypothetical protein